MDETSVVFFIITAYMTFYKIYFGSVIRNRRYAVLNEPRHFFFLDIYDEIYSVHRLNWRLDQNLLFLIRLATLIEIFIANVANSFFLYIFFRLKSDDQQCRNRTDNSLHFVNVVSLYLLSDYFFLTVNNFVQLS